MTFWPCAEQDWRADLEPKSLIQIITEEDFLELVKEPCDSFFRFFNSFASRLNNNKNISRKFYSNIIQEAELLESFLDDHGARENKSWTFFSECVASIRNLAIAAFFIRHILDRYPYYNLQKANDVREEFISASRQTLDFLNKSILDIYLEMKGSSLGLGLELTEEGVSQQKFGEVESNKRLPRNISDDEVKNEEERIIDICERIQKTADMMRKSKINQTKDLDELRKMVPWSIDEKKARQFKNLVHSVQSDFDTYVKNTRLEHENSNLKNLRGYISMPVHLLEFVLWLCHFYERHEDEIRHCESKRKISELVEKDGLLDRIVNYGFHYSKYFITEGSHLAREILATFIKVEQIELPIPKPLGFHARPSTYLSLIARNYGEDLFIIVDGEKFNAKSVMSLLQAGGTIADKGYQTIIFEGSTRVLDDVRVLAEHNYCEDQDVPSKLSYLREMRNTA
jgi:phosphotransferase system HPr (HPr) family protein